MTEPIETEPATAEPGTAEVEMDEPNDTPAAEPTAEPAPLPSRKRRATVQPTRFRDIPVDDKKARRAKLTPANLLTAARKSRPKMDPDLAGLSQMWELPELCHLCHMIGAPLKMTPFSVTEMERALLHPEHSQLLDELMSKLLTLEVKDATQLPKGCGFGYSVWNSMLRELIDVVLSLKSGKEVLFNTVFDENMNEETKELGVPELHMWSCIQNANPCSQSDFHQLPLPMRVRVLKGLMEHTIRQRAELTEAVREAGPAAARVDPLGVDTQGNQYYFFDVCNEPRIYLTATPKDTPSQNTSPEPRPNSERRVLEFELLFDLSSVDSKSLIRFSNAFKKLPHKTDKQLSESIEKAAEVMIGARAVMQRKQEAACRALEREMLMSQQPRRESARGVEKREHAEQEVKQHVTRQQQLIQDAQTAQIRVIQERSAEPQNLLQCFCDTQVACIKEARKCEEWHPAKRVDEMRREKNAECTEAQQTQQKQLQACVNGFKVRITFSDGPSETNLDSEEDVEGGGEELLELPDGINIEGNVT